jgi:hypothetical protein
MNAGGAPQGMGTAILRTKSLSSRLVPGRPDRFRLEIRVQKKRNPRRCHPMTVSGFTRSNASRQFGRARKSQTQNQRSAHFNRGRGHCLFMTVSCCRRARFSRDNSLALVGQTREQKIEKRNLNTRMNIRGTLGETQSF